MSPDISGEMQNPTDQVIDELLVLDAQNGSKEAFEMLVSRWQKRLWGHAFNLTRQPETAWDVTQEAWLSIVRGLSRLQDPAKFGSWAYQIVTHKSRDWLSRHGRNSLIADETGVEPDEVSSSMPEQHQKETAHDVRNILRRLPNHSQVVLNLYYMEGFCLVEIAEILGTPEGTVKSRLHTARNEFRKIWELLTGQPATVPSTEKREEL
jgi:RNA polymerase sigma-70 factor (ECF subfamily)